MFDVEKLDLKKCHCCGKPIRPKIGETVCTKADLILDPMGGVGTTGVEAVLLGRDCILIDIEKKFVQLMEGNLKNVKRINEKSRFKLRLGRAAVVKGDSRELAQLLQNKMDAVVTSPPYANQEVGKGIREKRWGKIKDRKGFKGRKEWMTGTPSHYSNNPENIGNLPHENNADVVITSPPYSGSVSKHAGGDKVRERFEGFMGESQLEARKYSEDERNIGNLQHGSADVVLTSPPYSEALSKRRKGYTKLKNLEHTREYPQESRDDNIGNLKHGEMADVVITSPPFGQSEAFHDLKFMKESAKNYIEKVKRGEVKGHHATPEARRKVFERCEEGKIENANNISMLREHGKVDAVLTSPPFGEANRGSGIAKKGYSGKHGVDPKLHERHDRPLSDDPDNISNLPLGKVDTVLTSPPFARTKGGLTGERNILAKIRKGEKPKRDFGGIQAMPRPCSDDPKNIENLSYEKVDTVITSPPFANIARSKEGGISPHMQGLISQLSGIPVSEFAHDVKKLREAVKIAQSKIPFKYSDDPQNIGNLKLGEVDAVLTSPPYAGMSQGKSREPLWERLAKDPTSKRFGRKKHPHTAEGYSQNPKNIGNLPPGKVDVVLTSPPYADIHQVPSNSPDWTAYFKRMLQEKGYIEWQGKRYTEAEWRRMNHGRIDGRSTKGLKKDAHYSDNPENIGNLPHTPVDTVITSPPYEGSFNVKQHTLSGIAKRDEKFRIGVGGYGPDDSNIGNLRRGKEGVDAIVTSPPYEGSVNAPNDPERRAERMRTAGLDPKTIVGGKARCGEIDWQYSQNQKNIGNEKGETYLSAMLRVYEEMYKVLKPNGLAIVVLKNFIRHFKVVDLIGDTVKLVENCHKELFCQCEQSY